MHDGVFEFAAIGKHGFHRRYKVEIVDGKVIFCDRASAVSRFFGKLTFTHGGDTARALKDCIDIQLQKEISTPYQCESGKFNIDEYFQSLVRQEKACKPKVMSLTQTMY